MDWGRRLHRFHLSFLDCRGNFTVNSASFGNWSFTTATNVNATQGAIGSGGANQTNVFDQFTDNSMYCSISDAAGSGRPAGTVTNGAGFFVCNRSASNVEQEYRNAVQIATGTEPATGLESDATLWIVGVRCGSGCDQAANRQIAMAFVGGSLTSGQVTAINSRVCTYLTTIHGSC
jgi:hypothetical protein